ncbi:hypothetical protein [Actibacterium sp. 188UL27-1]|uniref:hypothetical protein n=1 Tax=Actibacterium sp. 188UL27-1 TaxID=2786961 RepID=UPI00195DC8A9|nr:hypothetical protein [Actibacterium sp. 188UL27-1]MBM7067432.1 hypothetical protein [Actibacterium sp. 188UL27-1]
MTPAMQVAIAFGSVAILLGLMALVRRQARASGWSAEVQRKLVHIGTGLYALGLPWLFTDQWPVYMLIGITIVVMLILRLPRFAKGGLGETLHGVERQSWGDLLLALAIGVVFALSEGRAILYILPIATLTLADAAAALTGTRYGKQFFQIEDGQKSVEGSAVFFMVTLILSMVCLLLLTEVPRANVILLAVILAAFGTLVEADSWRGFDNFFLPTGLMLFLNMNLTAPALDLGLLILIYALAIWIFLRVAPSVGLTPHAVRVYVVAMFLILSVTQVQNAVLPALVFAAHALTCRAAPCQAQYPELDIVAAICLVSFAWLTAGLVTDMNALAFYGLTMTGLVIAFLTLSLGAFTVAIQVAAMAVLIAGGVALYTWLMTFNVATKMWAGSPTALALVTAAITATIPAVWPAQFANQRAVKLTVLAMACPVLGYVGLMGGHLGWL